MCAHDLIDWDEFSPLCSTYIILSSHYLVMYDLWRIHKDNALGTGLGARRGAIHFEHVRSVQLGFPLFGLGFRTGLELQRSLWEIQLRVSV